MFYSCFAVCYQSNVSVDPILQVGLIQVHSVALNFEKAFCASQHVPFEDLLYLLGNQKNKSPKLPKQKTQTKTEKQAFFTRLLSGEFCIELSQYSVICVLLSLYVVKAPEIGGAHV